MKNQIRGSCRLLLATLIWGTAFIAQSVGMDYIGPFTFQTIRCGMAAVFLFLASWVLEFRKTTARDFLNKWLDPKLWKTGLICGIALFVAQSLQQVGLVYTDAGKAGFITAMYIVLVPVLGVFFHRKPSRTAIFGVGLAVVGLYMLSCMGVSQVNIGDWMLMGCAMAFAVQIICIDRMADSMDGLRLNAIQAIVVTVISLPVMGLTEQVHLSSILSCWLPLCYAGILSMGVAYTLQILGQKDLEPTAASLIMSLESVIAALSGWLILKETMTGWELTGCCLVFIAVLLSQLPEKPLLPKPKTDP